MRLTNSHKNLILLLVTGSRHPENSTLRDLVWSMHQVALRACAEKENRKEQLGPSQKSQ